MTLLLALTAGVVFGCGMYMLLRRSVVKVVLGLALLSHGTHLLIFTAAGVSRGSPPLVRPGERALQPPYADPLPQALILTAIVISFALLAFAIVLASRAAGALGSDDTEAMRGQEDPSGDGLTAGGRGAAGGPGGAP